MAAAASAQWLSNVKPAQAWMFNWFQRSSKSASSTRAGRLLAQGSAKAPAKGVAKGVTTIAHTRLEAAADPAAMARLPAWARALGEDSQRILATLPPTVSLASSCSGYPRAVEGLLVHWRNPTRFRLALDDLLLPVRGDRQGFPFDVVVEFSALREYYDRCVAPVKDNAWGPVERR
jgi:hypothetical protein